jgi:hypothetical protein
LYGIVNLTQGERKLATRQKQSPFRHLADFGGKAMTMIKRDSAHPFSLQDVVGLSLAETIIIPRHLQTPEIRAFINLAPLTDLRNPDTPAPTAADESGRSAQIFLVDVVVRKGEEERRAVARGRDIYAITAPIVVEATQRVVNRLTKRIGVAAAGDLFDARDFLRSLCPAHLSIEIQ